MSAQDTIKATVEEILKVLSIKNVIGEPIEIEDKVLIPLTKIGMGFGGGGEGGKGTGAGGGAGVSPLAIVVIFKGVPGPEGVKVLPLEAPSPIAKTIGEAASSMMEMMRQKREAKREGEKQKQT
jgi:uncharacterized spore protein YtfJ